MSSIISTSFVDTFLSPYLNELIAITVFSLGYFLFKYWSPSKRHDEKPNAKIQISTQNDPTQALYQYNLYIRDNLSHKPNLNVFEVLHQMQLENIIPDVTSYNTLTDICVEQKQFTQAKKLFSEMFDSICPIKPDIITFNTMLKGICIELEEMKKNENFNELQEPIQDMINLKEKYESIELQPNEITFNTMIDACVKSGNMKLAFELFEEMQLKNELKPDVFTYSSLIKGIKSPENIGNNNNLERILNILEQVKENELVKGDEILYNCVIDACFKFSDYNQAIKVYNDMINFDIKPSAVTYGIMIKGYGQFKKLDSALKMYQTMKEEGIKLNEITLGCLIDACIKCGKLTKALEIIDSEKNVPINTIIFTTLLKGFTKEKNLTKALDMFSMMKNNPQIKPNIITYNSLLDCAVQSNEFIKMEEIFNEIMKKSESNIDCIADIITYSTYIKGLCRCKRNEEAYNHFIQLRNDKKFKVDEVLYNSLLDGLIKSREYEKSLEVYTYMQQDGIKPSNVTYSILIKMFSNLGKVDKALDMLQEMKNENLKPGLIVYTCLIQTCIKFKKIDLIMKLYNEMKDGGIRGDVVFYNTLISGLVFNYDLKNACEIMLFTLEKNMQLNDDVYCNVLRNLCNCLNKKNLTNLNLKDCEINLLKIAQNMRKNGIEIEEKLYNQITAYLYNENMGNLLGSRKDKVGRNSDFNREKENKNDFFSRAVKK